MVKKKLDNQLNKMHGNKIWRGEERRRWWKRKVEKDNERKETRSIGRTRKKRGIVRIVTARSMPLWTSYRIPRRNASQHPNKQQQFPSFFCRWTYHDHLSLLFFSRSLFLLLLPLLTHMAADLYLLPIKRAELDQFKKKASSDIRRNIHASTES